MSNLVLQAPTLERPQVEALATMFDGPVVESIGPGAYRLKAVPVREAVASWCEERHIDHAWMPEGRRFSDLKLLAMDMDSTLITVECIDELGDLAGKRAEIASITARAMRGELDYPASLRQRVALLAGLKESALARVYEERVKLTPGAQDLLSECKKHGLRLLLVSGGFTFFVERLRERLGIDYTISNVLQIDNGRLTGQVLGDIVDAEAKAARFREIAGQLAAEKHQTVAIGDGANDLKMMAEAGVSVAFRAKPVVRAQASCALNWSGLDAVVRLFE